MEVFGVGGVRSLDLDVHCCGHDDFMRAIAAFDGDAYGGRLGDDDADAGVLVDADVVVDGQEENLRYLRMSGQAESTPLSRGARTYLQATQPQTPSSHPDDPVRIIMDVERLGGRHGHWGTNQADLI